MATGERAGAVADGLQPLAVRTVASLPRIASALRDAVAGAGGRLAGEAGPEPDVVLGWYADLTDEDIHICRERRVAVVMALALDRLLEASLLAPDADGWLFVDRQLGQARSILELSRSGHCVVPDAIGSLAAVDSLRMRRLGGLTRQEREVLACLGEGMTNRRIAGLLGISEASTKYVVRSVLTKLRLPNRTSAGVFAASHPGQ